MKRYLAVALLALGLFPSCIRKQVVIDLAGQRDSLTTVVDRKDSLIRVVFDDMNAIADNLARIRNRENLLVADDTPEGGRRTVEQIGSDIAAIDRLLQENESKIESMQRIARQLRKADLRIEGLEKMIGNLKSQLAEKQAEVERLQSRLERSDARVEELTEQVARTEARIETLNDENLELTNRLHTVYYIVGGEKELRDAQIIGKEGFIGRTLTVGQGGAIESFTQSDSRLLSEIPIGRKRAKVVTSHPENSYKLVVGADKSVEKLLITDPSRFWESSKILIISYK